MKQLEAGYSVSDTEDDLGSAMNDILSANSYYQGNKGFKGMPGMPVDMPFFSPQLGGSPSAPNAWEDGVETA